MTPHDGVMMEVKKEGAQGGVFREVKCTFIFLSLTAYNIKDFFGWVFH